MVAPTSEMDVVAFGCRANKDLYLTLHNKKETRGGLSVRVFLHRIVFNLKTVMLLPFQAAKTLVGNIGSIYVQTLLQHHRKVFCFFFSKKKRKLLLQSNFSKQLAAELIGGFGREVGWRDIEY